MLDDKDIQKIISVVATKEDIRDLKQYVNGLREMTQSLVLSVDKAEKLGIKLEY